MCNLKTYHKPSLMQMIVLRKIRMAIFLYIKNHAADSEQKKGRANGQIYQVMHLVVVHFKKYVDKKHSFKKKKLHYCKTTSITTANRKYYFHNSYT